MQKRTYTLTAAALAVALASPAFAQTTKPDPMAKPGTATESHMNKPGSMANPSTMTRDAATAMPTDQVNFVQNQNATDWRGSNLIGATVYGPDNASIGDVNEVLIANDGRTNAVVIGVGGFLGVGEKDVAVPFEKLSVTRKPQSADIDKVTINYTKDELTNAPKFAYYDPGTSTTTGSGTTDKMKSLNPMNDTSKK
ncbi:MAG: PRC-barrel domain-containing protein [Pseudolabrys sp.]|nr:PRC-barrel domain-containing protein [Pseudolabrys sp.]